MERGLRPRVLANTEGNRIGRGSVFLAIERGAAHSNTQEKRDKSRDSSLGCRESTDSRECDRRSNLGLHSRPKSTISTAHQRASPNRQSGSIEAYSKQNRRP